MALQVGRFGEVKYFETRFSENSSKQTVPIFLTKQKSVPWPYALTFKEKDVGLQKRLKHKEAS